jgi:hypothetical protein
MSPKKICLGPIQHALTKSNWNGLIWAKAIAPTNLGRSSLVAFTFETRILQVKKYYKIFCYKSTNLYRTCSESPIQDNSVQLARIKKDPFSHFFLDWILKDFIYFWSHAGGNLLASFWLSLNSICCPPSCTYSRVARYFLIQNTKNKKTVITYSKLP